MKVQARICNDLVILFLRPAVSRPHTEKKTHFNVRLTCRRSKNVLSDEGQFVINVHSVVPEVHRIRSIRSCEVMIFHLKHVLLYTWTTDCQFPSPCSVTSYGPRIWFTCSHSICFRFFICFSIRFVFVLVFI